MSLRNRVIAVVLVGLGVVTLAPARSDAQSPGGPYASVEDAVQAGALDPALVQSVRSGSGATVVVRLDRRQVEVDAVITPTVDPSALHRRADNARRLLSEIRKPEDRDVKDLPYIGARRVTVRSEKRLLELANSPAVSRLNAPISAVPHGTESMPQVRQPTAQAAGATGKNQVVAVMDNGDHGTNVAAIAQLAAPSATVQRYELNSDFTGQEEQFDAILEDRANGVNIRALNLSWGRKDAVFAPGSCPTNWDDELKQVAEAGIVIAVSAGNDGSSTGLSSPGCSPWVIGVGAVYDYADTYIGSCTDSATNVDEVTCFSNSSTDLDLLAPGARITAGGFTSSGTSQAAPHVAGAVAAIATTRPMATTAMLRAAVLTSGTKITDARNSITRPRLDIESARKALVNMPAPAFRGLVGTDVDNDGKADVMGRETDGDLSFYRGLGTPGAAKLSYEGTAAGGFGHYDVVVAGDFDSDNKRDVIGRRPNGELVFHRGTGSPGTAAFATGVKFNSGWDAFDTLVAGDFDVDGKADLIGRKPNGELHFYKGTGTPGSAGFSAKGKFNAGWQVFDTLVAGDFDVDGKADLIGRKPNGELHFYKGTGTPGSAGFSAKGKFNAGWQVFDTLVAGDFDVDGKADLIGRKPNGELHFYKGTGTPGSAGFSAKGKFNTGWQMFH